MMKEKNSSKYMSTRGIIAIEKPDKTCRAVYVHFDMCLDSAGICLTQHYTAREAVALANQGLLAAPERITVRSVAGEKFDRITRWVLKDRPVMREPGDDSAEIESEYPSNSPGDLGVSQDFNPDDIPF